VQNGQIVYTHAYGDAQIDTPRLATTSMRYSVGSVSKQFTATALLMLAEQGKLSLNDPVGKFVPNLTRGNEVTIREILSHTSGYQDYWPQDYVPPFMLQPINAQGILDRWARKPLDFEPGTRWQYSNTGFVIAGLIVEKASGTPLLDFLSKRIFTPLGMTSVLNVDQQKLTESDPTGYVRYALGPLRVAPKEGKGWLFAAGELAMTASDLAKWDIAMMHQKLLKPASYRAMQTDTLLKDGRGTKYGLGIGVLTMLNHRALEHGGEVSGFMAENLIFPDDDAAIVVQVNTDTSSAAEEIGHRVAPLLFTHDDTERKQQQAEQIFETLQQGKIDRALFTDNCNAYFSEQVLKDFADSLGPLGRPQSFEETGRSDRGGMQFRLYVIRFADRSVNLSLREMPDGKIEQYQVSP
jgi:D-alanyl-D-alanine carboxypeptidase